jgi:hypothetical protein
MFWGISYYLCAFGAVWLPYETRCKMDRTNAKVRAPKSHRTFRNEHTQSTTLDPKLMFWCVLYYLGTFGTVWLPYETRSKTGRSSAKVCATKSRRNFSQRTYPITLLHRKLTFWCVSYYLGAFGTVWYLTKLSAKQAELVQKFVPRSRVGIFRNERTHSTPLDPKLTFWCVLYYLGAFGTVWLPYETWCKTGRASAKVRATKLRQNFFATNALNPPHWTIN